MKRIIVVSVAACLVTGCATSGGANDKTANTALGAGIGCVAGAVLAKALGGKAAAGCAAGAVVGGIIGYEQARQKEIAAAEAMQKDVVAAVAGASVRPIVTEPVAVKDQATGEVRQIQAYKSATIDLPLSKKGTPEFNSAMDKVKAYAERIANERGESEIVVAMNPADMHAQHVAQSTTVVPNSTGAGNIRFDRVADATLKKGVERVTIQVTNRSQVQV